MAVSPLDTVAMPARIAALPRDRRGYPVPFFVEWRDGVPLFPVLDPNKWRRCVGHSLCWTCGEPLGRNLSFPIGPMCTINRITSEPASHLDCATYALRVCPFLITPGMRRVPLDKIGVHEHTAPPGIHDPGNPGVMALWCCRTFSIMRTDTGPLIELGAANDVSWWRRGALATAQEAADGLRAGAAKLLAVAAVEGQEAIAEFTTRLIQARRLLPDPSLLRDVVEASR